jgi:hypothetical protein
MAKCVKCGATGKFVLCRACRVAEMETRQGVDKLQEAQRLQQRLKRQLARESVKGMRQRAVQLMARLRTTGGPTKLSKQIRKIQRSIIDVHGYLGGEVPAVSLSTNMASTTSGRSRPKVATKEGRVLYSSSKRNPQTKLTKRRAVSGRGKARASRSR